MTAHWQGQIPQAPNAGALRGERARGSVTPRASLAVGRYMGTVIVTLHGDLHLSASVQLAGVLRDLIDGQGNLAVVVDLGDVGGIDRSGLDVLSSSAARMATRGGTLRLGRPTDTVFDALSVAGLARFIAVPPEQAHRPRSAGRNVHASRRASINSHPAGSGRYDQQDRGDAS